MGTVKAGVQELKGRPGQGAPARTHGRGSGCKVKSGLGARVRDPAGSRAGPGLGGPRCRRRQARSGVGRLTRAPPPRQAPGRPRPSPAGGLHCEEPWVPRATIRGAGARARRPRGAPPQRRLCWGFRRQRAPAPRGLARGPCGGWRRGGPAVLTGRVGGGSDGRRFPG